MDRKIRKAINQSLQTTKSFEDFCQEKEIDMVAECKHTKHREKKKLIWSIASVVATAVVVLICCMTMLMPKDSVEKVYGENDVAQERITMSDLEKVQNLFLLDKDNIAQHGLINKITPLDNYELILAYSQKEIIYGFQSGIEFYAFQIDYMARCSTQYYFAGLNEFQNFTNIIEESKGVYQYKIVTTEKETALVKFELQNIEYYLIIKPFEDLIDINEKSITILMNNLLT